MEWIPVWQALDLILPANMLLWLFAGRILRPFSKNSPETREFKRQVSIFRSFNLFMILAYLGYRNRLFTPESPDWWMEVLVTVLVAYMAYLAMHVTNYFIRRRSGQMREVGGQIRHIETHSTRLFSIFINLLIVIIALLSIVHILGATSLLKAGGVIGFIGVVMALTQSTWAPDMFSGLIILDSEILAEGDMVELQGADVLGVVFKTKMFHTEILNPVNNHRIMIRNAALRNYTVHNLSKFASAKGLHECLRFKIGYDTPPEQVKKMFAAVFAKIEQTPKSGVQTQHGFSTAVLDTADYAVEWGFYYYTKEVKKIIAIRNQVRELVLSTSLECGIALATPDLHTVSLLQTPPDKA